MVAIDGEMEKLKLLMATLQEQMEKVKNCIENHHSSFISQIEENNSRMMDHVADVERISSHIDECLRKQNKMKIIQDYRYLIRDAEAALKVTFPPALNPDLTSVGIVHGLDEVHIRCPEPYVGSHPASIRKNYHSPSTEQLEPEKKKKESEGRSSIGTAALQTPISPHERTGDDSVLVPASALKVWREMMDGYKEIASLYDTVLKGPPEAPPPSSSSTSRPNPNVQASGHMSSTSFLAIPSDLLS